MIVIIAHVCIFVRPCASKHQCRPVAARSAGEIHVRVRLNHHTHTPAPVSHTHTHTARAWRVLALISSHQLGFLHHMEEVRIPDVPSG